MINTTTELNNPLLQEWMDRLRLNDWVIKVNFNCSPNDMILKDVCGETEWDEVNKCAKINIIDKKDYGDRIVPFDEEKTLVHELLHLKFSLLGENENELQNRLVHQLIDDLAKALIDAKKELSK